MKDALLIKCVGSPVDTLRVGETNNVTNGIVVQCNECGDTSAIYVSENDATRLMEWLIERYGGKNE